MYKLSKDRDLIVSTLEFAIKSQKNVRKLLISDLEKNLISLKTRWSLYQSAEWLLPVDSTFHKPDGINWKRFTLNDHFYLNKYETITVNRMIKLSKDSETWDDEPLIYDMDAFKEYWLKQAYSGFIYDW